MLLELLKTGRVPSITSFPIKPYRTSADKEFSLNRQPCRVIGMMAGPVGEQGITPV
ncbi:MAG TPA: hypothetical protein VHB01_07005 [Nitrosospira sp.]|nr:hypothetical protein [Nitrosospira sp.]